MHRERNLEQTRAKTCEAKAYDPTQNRVQLDKKHTDKQSRQEENIDYLSDPDLPQSPRIRTSSRRHLGA
jgi:hypothetical protein